ncbi:MAG: hypothetical protein GC164_07940 [Phycisphaera sp.]|nr:hypothetical protein [Phycisphaera sp.]
MDTIPTPQIALEQDANGGVRLVLPERPRVRSVGAGVFLFVFGLVFGGGPTLGMFGGPLPMVFFALPFLLIGLGMIGVGVLLLIGYYGRTEVSVGGGRVRSTEHVGPMRWTRGKAVAPVKRIEVTSDPIKINNKPIQNGFWADASAMRLVLEGDKKFIVTALYPRVVMDELASHMSELLSVGSQPIAVVELKEGEEVVADPAMLKPEKSVSVVEHRPDGITITVPRAGMRGTKGLGCFAVFWLGFMVLFTALGGKGFFSSVQGIGAVLALVGFFALFWGVGIGMAVYAWHLATRTAILDTVGQTLVVTRKGLFGLKQQEWAASEIEKIVMGPSGMEVNDVPVMELQVHPRGGKKVGLLSQLDNEELRWLAAELRAALGL